MFQYPKKLSNPTPRGHSQYTESAGAVTNPPALGALVVPFSSFQLYIHRSDACEEHRIYLIYPAT